VRNTGRLNNQRTPAIAIRIQRLAKRRPGYFSRGETAIGLSPARFLRRLAGAGRLAAPQGLLQRFDLFGKDL
jgi:hypothetical protein